MKNLINHIVVLFAVLTVNFSGFSQVGIGTKTPDASSMLDIQSTTHGMLTPRMTGAQRIAIANPAEGLLVFDTDAKEFYQFNGSIWEPIKGENSGRTNYKLVQSIADLSDELTAGGGSKYLLDADTMYEINGTMLLSYPIDLNNSYLIGGDTSMDVLVSTTGDLFVSSKGGVIKNLTLSAPGGNVFKMNDSAGDQIFMERDCLIVNSSNVGEISGYHWVLVDKISLSNNSNGVVFRDIDDLSIESAAWHDSNTGTYEKFEGSFVSIQKSSGFSEVSSGAVAFDFSSNPNVGHGVIFSTVIINDGSGTSIKGYTTYNSDDHRNFPKQWVIDCVGIPVERDEIATANMYWDIPIGEYSSTNLGNNKDIIKLNSVITGAVGSKITKTNLLFRFEENGANNLKYDGKSERYFQVNCTGSYRPENDETYVFYIVKVLEDGTTLEVDKASRSVRQAETNWNKNNDGGIFNFGITAHINLKPGESIEVHGQCFDENGGAVDIYALNFNIF